MSMKYEEGKREQMKEILDDIRWILICIFMMIFCLVLDRSCERVAHADMFDYKEIPPVKQTSEWSWWGNRTYTCVNCGRINYHDALKEPLNAQGDLQFRCPICLEVLKIDRS